MKKPAHIVEIFLQPGDLYFGDRDTRIRTVLGSCVSLTFWHHRLLVGGMCHYMLPRRAQREGGALDGRYGDEAVAMMRAEIAKLDVSPREFVVKLFGGGNMFPSRGNSASHVGVKNVAMARELVKRHGFNCVAEHMGGNGHRNIIFDIWNGNVWMKHASGRGISLDMTDRRTTCAVYA